MYSVELNNINIIFVGDLNSVNLEIISKCHNKLKKLKYLLIGDLEKINNYLKKINSNIGVIEIFEIKEAFLLETEKFFVFDTQGSKKNNPIDLLNQINISNNLSKLNNSKLITMPIDKSFIKKKFKFNGMTEYLSLINDKKTFMLMKGDKFSIVPLTTHIPFKHILKNFSEKKLTKIIFELIKILNDEKIKYKNIIFLGINPHAGENGTLGNEEYLLTKIINNLKLKFKKFNFKGPLPADSAFNQTKMTDLFISLYHDQALIPFKLLNKKAINYTIGLDYKRFSPAHGTASDILFKNKANLDSFVECILN